MMEDKQTKNSTPKNSTWNYHPELPIPLSPIFAWPPKPLAWFKWLSGYWFAISSTTIILALALTAYALSQPEWDAMQTFAPGWIFTIWLRNIILLTLVAGSLHLWFITFSKQGRELKFDSRDQVKNSKVFSFSNQVWDNMFWSLASGISAWTIWEVLYFWAAANGYVPRLLSVHDNPAWFIGFFFIIPIWSSFHFYCIHRILHWPPLYRRVHALHHRNINIGPWAGISMHPVETLMYFSSVMLHFVVLSHPAHVIFHLCVEGLNPAFSHSALKPLWQKTKSVSTLATFSTNSTIAILNVITELPKCHGIKSLDRSTMEAKMPWIKYVPEDKKPRKQNHSETHVNPPQNLAQAENPSVG